ncbi:MAG: hypothetical protein ACFFG0_39060 [Candidatus Thorarchaeota archaeon]
MSSISNTDGVNCFNVEQFRKVLRVLNQIVDYIEKFEDHYDKKFNFSKLVKLLNIPKAETDDIVGLILNFQDIFENVFRKHRLQKYRAANQIYLITEEKCLQNQIKAFENLMFTSSQINILNDIIYVFKHVKRGKGFDIVKNGSELLTKVKQLRNAHPYLFELKGNGLIYPSQLGLKLGELIISYNKSNKTLDRITLDSYMIEVKKDK